MLLATSSFWQGVDVVGDALSCVVIDKLPFAVARRSGDGRAHRRHHRAGRRRLRATTRCRSPSWLCSRDSDGSSGTGSDRGVLAILDPRLRTMGYGRRFLASLPPAPVTHDLDAVARFFR